MLAIKIWFFFNLGYTLVRNLIFIHYKLIISIFPNRFRLSIINKLIYKIGRKISALTQKVSTDFVTIKMHAG